MEKRKVVQMLYKSSLIGRVSSIELTNSTEMFFRPEIFGIFKPMGEIKQLFTIWLKIVGSLNNRLNGYVHCV